MTDRHATEAPAARRKRIESLDPLFRPRAVAVIGASPSADSIGRNVLERLLDGRFDGPVYPVHPRAHAVSAVIRW